MVSACFLCYSIDRSQEGPGKHTGGESYETKRKSNGTCYGISDDTFGSGRLWKSGEDGHDGGAGGGKHRESKQQKRRRELRPRTPRECADFLFMKIGGYGIS